VNKRKNRLNTGCVSKPYEHSANENFVHLEELPFSDENDIRPQHRPRFANVLIKNLPHILKIIIVELVKVKF
jgi:hypothetical protein